MGNKITHGRYSFDSIEEFEEFKRKYPFKYKPADQWSVTPKFYYHGRDGGDLVWIDKNLSRLHSHNRQIACEDYEFIYQRVGRKAANGWLSAFCDHFGLTKIDYEEAREIHDYRIEKDSNVAKILARIRDNKPRARSKWGEVFAAIDGDLDDLEELEEL